VVDVAAATPSQQGQTQFQYSYPRQRRRDLCLAQGVPEAGVRYNDWLDRFLVNGSHVGAGALPRGGQRRSDIGQYRNRRTKLIPIEYDRIHITFFSPRLISVARELGRHNNS